MRTWTIGQAVISYCVHFDVCKQGKCKCVDRDNAYMSVIPPGLPHQFPKPSGHPTPVSARNLASISQHSQHWLTSPLPLVAASQTRD